MNARGERILIFGDSLTQHASGAQPVWNVDQGSQRQSSGPGDLLASLLLEQGATVRTNALVSRSAFNFWTREAAQSLIAADLAWKPTKIVFVLGTNDVGLGAGPDEAAFIRLRDAYAPSKAEMWAIGPFKSRLPPTGVDGTAAIMERVFGRRFIDGRRLSEMISNGPDGVHYEPTGARLLALNMADALLSASPVKPWMGLAIGMAIVIGGGLAYSAWARSSGLRGLGAAFAYKFRARPNSHPLAIRVEPHGQYQVFQRPNDFLVRFYPAVGAVLSNTKDSEKLGTFATIEALDDAIEQHGARQRYGLKGLGAEYLPPGGYFHVDQAARAVPERERFGQRKAFISDVHEQLTRVGIDISLEDLKRELIRMHHDQNVRLARADLVAAMDPNKVKASEAREGNATFHFVVVDDLGGLGSSRMTGAGMHLWRKEAGANEVVVWHHERDVTPETAEQWLAIFQRDRPDVEFRIAAKRPAGKKGNIKLFKGPGSTY